MNGPVVRNAILYKLFKKFLRFLQRQQGFGVPFAEVAGGDLVQSALRQREDAELVGHDAAAPTDALGQLVLGELVFFHQGFESVGGLEHGQIFALKILYEGDLAEELLVATDDAHGHFRESGQLAGVKTAFAGNDAVFLRAFCRRGGDDQRLKQPMNFDGRRQFVQRCAVEELAGLMGIGLDIGQRGHFAVLGDAAHVLLGQQRAEAAPRLDDGLCGSGGFLRGLSRGGIFAIYSHSLLTSNARS